MDILIIHNFKKILLILCAEVSVCMIGILVYVCLCIVGYGGLFRVRKLHPDTQRSDCPHKGKRG